MFGHSRKPTGRYLETLYQVHGNTQVCRALGGAPWERTLFGGRARLGSFLSGPPAELQLR